MKIGLKKLDHLSGEKASFYSVLIDGKDLFKIFCDENVRKFETELLQMMGRLKNMGSKNAATENFFKLEESSNPNDEKVVCYFDLPYKKVRVFCVRLSEKIVLIGGGGEKPWWCIKWQHSPKLKKEAEYIMTVSELIDKLIENGKFSVSGNGLDIISDLTLN